MDLNNIVISLLHATIVWIENQSYLQWFPSEEQVLSDFVSPSLFIPLNTSLQLLLQVSNILHFLVSVLVPGTLCSPGEEEQGADEHYHDQAGVVITVYTALHMDEDWEKRLNITTRTYHLVC